MGMSSDDLLNAMGQSGTFPAVNPPATGFSGSSVYTGGLSLMGPGGLPWGQQSIQTLMANTPPPALYGQTPNPYAANPYLGKVNTGSAMDPPTPQPPTNDQNQPNPNNSTGQAPSDSASG